RVRPGGDPDAPGGAGRGAHQGRDPDLHPDAAPGHPGAGAVQGVRAGVRGGGGGAGRGAPLAYRAAVAGAPGDEAGLAPLPLLPALSGPLVRGDGDRPQPARRGHGPVRARPHPEPPGAGPARARRPAVKRIPPPDQLGRLWPRVRPYRWGLALAMLTLVLSGAIGLAFPQIVRYLLDAAFLRHDRALLDRIALLLVGLFVVQAVLNYAQTYLLSATGERVVAGLRRELFDRLLEMPPGFFAERRTGELTSRLTVDVGLLQGVLSH